MKREGGQDNRAMKTIASLFNGEKTDVKDISYLVDGFDIFAEQAKLNSNDKSLLLLKIIKQSKNIQDLFSFIGGHDRDAAQYSIQRLLSEHRAEIAGITRMINDSIKSCRNKRTELGLIKFLSSMPLNIDLAIEYAHAENIDIKSAGFRYLENCIKKGSLLIEKKVGILESEGVDIFAFESTLDKYFLKRKSVSCVSSAAMPLVYLFEDLAFDAVYDEVIPGTMDLCTGRFKPESESKFFERNDEVVTDLEVPASIKAISIVRKAFGNSAAMPANLKFARNVSGIIYSADKANGSIINEEAPSALRASVAAASVILAISAAAPSESHATETGLYASSIAEVSKEINSKTWSSYSEFLMSDVEGLASSTVDLVSLIEDKIDDIKSSLKDQEVDELTNKLVVLIKKARDLSGVNHDDSVKKIKGLALDAKEASEAMLAIVNKSETFDSKKQVTHSLSVVVDRANGIIDMVSPQKLNRMFKSASVE